jgi:O-antigen ligase
MTTVAADPPVTPARVPPRVLAALGRGHVVLPGLASLAMAFRAGGYFPAATGVLAAALAILLGLRIALGRRPVGGAGAALAVMGLALTLFGGWALLSQTWSHAPTLAFIETDRTLAYVLVAGVMGSFAARRGDLDAVLRFVLLAIFVVAVAALLTRLFPGTFPSSDSGRPSRLAFPLTYWNALGIFCAVGVVLSLHVTAGGREPAVARVLAAASMPVLGAVMLLTFSRGALGAAVIGVVFYVVLAHGRRLVPALLAVAAPMAVSLLVTYNADGLGTDDYRAARADAHRVATVVAACVLAALVLRALALWLDGRLDRIEVSTRRRVRVLSATAAVALVVLVVGGVAAHLPSRISDQVSTFAKSAPIDDNDGADSRSRLLDASSNGRRDHWRVSWDGFTAHPLNGTGAGTYKLEWEQHRRSGLDVNDGHSLYFETLGEMGLVGLGLLLVALLTPLLVAARRLLGPERHVHAAFIAAGLTLLIHAGVDWDWEMPALFAWFWGAAGVVCARRAAAVVASPVAVAVAAPAAGVPAGAALVAAAVPVAAAAGPGSGSGAGAASGRGSGSGRARPGRDWPRAAVRVSGVVACLALAVAPATLATSQSRVDDASRAFLRGDCDTAIRDALHALDVLSRPEPFEILGYCDLRAGQISLAEGAFASAHERDPDDWHYLYGAAIARAMAGGDPRPLIRASAARNPRNIYNVTMLRRFTKYPRSQWRTFAHDASIPTN